MTARYLCLPVVRCVARPSCGRAFVPNPVGQRYCDFCRLKQSARTDRLLYRHARSFVDTSAAGDA